MTSRPVRFLLPILLACLSGATASLAQKAPAHPAAPPAAKPAKPEAPKSIGKFDDWRAATHAEAGQLVCYAFTRVQSSQPSLPGRGDVVMTVTQRATLRDAVAISAGFNYPPNAEVQVQSDKGELPFYTNARSAFARDGKAVTAAFGASGKAIAKSPGPKGAPVTDTFSLRGFSAAYAAINKACPPK